MTYEEIIKTYIDPNGLIGAHQYPEKWSTGNGILLTTLARIIAPISQIQGLLFLLAITQCENPRFSGIFFKNSGRTDQISHDDMIAAAYWCSEDVFNRIENHGWVLSNTGKFYWDAWVKPWHRAYYLLMAGKSHRLYELLLALMLITDGIFNKKDSSGKIVNFLICKCLKNKSKIVDFGIRMWENTTIRRWGSYRDIFKTYFGPNHPFSIFVQERL